MWRVLAIVILVGIGVDLYLFDGRYIQAGRSVLSHLLRR